MDAVHDRNRIDDKHAWTRRPRAEQQIEIVQMERGGCGLPEPSAAVKSGLPDHDPAA